uniref:Auxin-responsive protein SAUR71-like n=2 Tax=Elaeis guineensis var. tenera TaxID=51953 RepID=A0A8N4FBW4_ELAGV|nr:auxin-responsive protein SAUR71-like [Elaeis guineensis]
MEKVETSEGKQGLILKTIKWCRSLGHRRSRPTSMPKSESWQRSRSTVKHRIAPGGYFSVYVGPNKERLMIKMECVNHPLFKDLLDEAEMEYGFKTEGPLELPCDVDLFHQVLREIDQEMTVSPECGFTKISNGYRLLSPSCLSSHGSLRSMIIISSLF